MTENGQIFTFEHFFGAILLGLIAGLSTLAGLGGGGPSVVTLIIFFDLLPKDSTIVVFACILGSSFGNITNQMTKTHNREPVINYKFAFLSCPLMFLGTLVGVFLNNWLPSAAVVLIIISQAFKSIPKIYKRFIQNHIKQTQIIRNRIQNNRHSDVIRVDTINPFDDQLNLLIFRQLGIFVIIFILVSMSRGTNKFPSILGVTSCSFSYWVLTIAMFGLTSYFYFWNKRQLQVWNAPRITLGQQLFEHQDVVQKNKDNFISSSIWAGLFSGFGLGGGMFLVPLYQSLGLGSLQATATCTFSIFITAIINVIQAIYLGVLSFSQFFTYFSMSFAGSMFFSVIVAEKLRKANRLSYVQLFLFILLLGTNFLLPFGLWLKYHRSGNDPTVVFGFGSIC